MNINNKLKKSIGIIGVVGAITICSSVGINTTRVEAAPSPSCLKAPGWLSGLGDRLRRFFGGGSSGGANITPRSTSSTSSGLGSGGGLDNKNLLDPVWLANVNSGGGSVPTPAPRTNISKTDSGNGGNRPIPAPRTNAPSTGGNGGNPPIPAPRTNISKTGDDGVDGPKKRAALLLSSGLTDGDLTSQEHLDRIINGN